MNYPHHLQKTNITLTTLVVKYNITTTAKRCKQLLSKVDMIFVICLLTQFAKQDILLIKTTFSMIKGHL